MHITIMTLYGLTVWLSAMAYALITGQVRLLHVALAGPLIISGAVLALALMDCALSWVLSKFKPAREANDARP